MKTAEDNLSFEVLEALGPLRKMSPWPGLLKSLTFVAAVLLSTHFSLMAPGALPATGFACVAALFYVGLISMMHDALHGALTGIWIYDEAFGRLVTYPVFHLYGLYSFLHNKHHRNNGRDLDDPERYQLTRDEYESLGPLSRWLFDHVLVQSIVGGAIGLLGRVYLPIGPTFRKYPAARKAIVTDLLGVVIFNALVIGAMISRGLGLRYLLLIVVIERLTGGIHQLVSRLAHNEKWFQYEKFIPSQILNTRMVSGPRWVSFFLNNLNLHTAHHVVPNLPYYRLPEANRILREICLKNTSSPPFHEDATYRVAVHGNLPVIR